MTSPDTLQELMDRVGKLTGPDRDVELEVAWALLPTEDRKEFDGIKHFPTIWFAKEGQAYGPLESLRYDDARVPRITHSVDAVLSLIERVLPGWRWDVAGLTDSKASASIWDDDYFVGETFAPTPALALLHALLSAKLGAPHA